MALPPIGIMTNTGHRIPAQDISWAKELAKVQKEIFQNLSDLEEMKFDFFQNRICLYPQRVM